MKLTWVSGLLMLAGVVIAPQVATATAARHLLPQTPATFPTLADALDADANRTLLLAALKASPVFEPLITKAETAVLLIAPSDAAVQAFLKLTGQSKDVLLGSASGGVRDAILKYHVVSDAKAPLTSGSSLTTELPNATPFTVTVNTTGIYIEGKDGVKFMLGPEIVAGNSKIRNINGVLIPPPDLLVAAVLG